MRIKWQLLPLIIIVFIFLSWLIVEGFGLLTFDDVITNIQRMNPLNAATVIIFLLIIDVFIPIPSTILIAMSGSLFNFWGGTLLTLGGSMVASLLAYGVGRYGSQAIINRLVSTDELNEMTLWSNAYGKWAVVLARSLPMMAETVGISAGVGHMHLASFMFYTLIGTLPICVMYVLAGTQAEQVEEILMITVAGVLLAGGISYLLRQRLHRSS